MEPLTAVAGVAVAVAAVMAILAGWQWVDARRARGEAGRLRRQLVVERRAAAHDELTGLPNRRSFHRAGSTLIREAARRPLVAIVVDLDDFKGVNDTFGHHIGDEVLIAVARRIAGVANDGLVARLGGDQFVALLDWTQAYGEAAAAYRHRLPEIVERIAQALSVPIPVAGGWKVAVGASVGFAPVNAATDLDELLDRADATMYRAKAAPASRAPAPLKGGRMSSDLHTISFSGGDRPAQVRALAIDALSSSRR